MRCSSWIMSGQYQLFDSIPRWESDTSKAHERWRNDSRMNVWVKDIFVLYESSRHISIRDCVRCAFVEWIRTEELSIRIFVRHFLHANISQPMNKWQVRTKEVQMNRWVVPEVRIENWHGTSDIKNEKDETRCTYRKNRQRNIHSLGSEICAE
jgi:hypothetical protein